MEKLFLSEFPELSRETLRFIKKGFDTSYRAFSREYGDTIEAVFDPVLYFLVWFEKLLQNSPWPIVLICFLAIIYFEQISDEKKDLAPLIKANNKIDFFLKFYPNSEYAMDLRFKKDLIQNQLAAKELFVARFYISTKKWVPAINRLKVIVKDLLFHNTRKSFLGLKQPFSRRMCRKYENIVDTNSHIIDSNEIRSREFENSS